MAALNRALVVALLLVGGCASFMCPDAPRTVRPGGRDVMFAPTVYLGRHDGNGINTDLVMRWGLSDRTDLGLRLNLFSVGTDLKVQLRRAPDPTRGVDVALAPSIGYGGDITWEGSSQGPGGGDSIQPWQFALPLLVGINFGERQLVLTPQVLYQRISALPAGVLSVGGTMAFGRMSGPGFSVYPVIAVWKAADPRRPFSSLGHGGEIAVQPGAVFHWGR